MSAEPDMEKRDPNELNNHVKVRLNKIKQQLTLFNDNTHTLNNIHTVVSFSEIKLSLKRYCPWL